MIFIVPFDPKGRDFKDYRFVYSDKRDKTIELGDRSEIIFLNTKGKIGNIQADLQDFYNLVNNEPTLNRSFIKHIEKSMALCRDTEGWKKHAMNTEELIYDDVNKLINALRDFNATDKQIYERLIKDYGDEFTKDELKKMLKEAKR